MYDSYALVFRFGVTILVCACITLGVVQNVIWATTPIQESLPCQLQETIALGGLGRRQREQI